MREDIRSLLSDKVHRYGIFLSIGITVVGGAFFLLNMRELPPLLPIFFNRPWGGPQLGTGTHVLFLLLSSTIILFVNLALAAKLYKSIILLSRILIWVSVVTSFLTTIAVIRILLLVS